MPMPLEFIGMLLWHKFIVLLSHTVIAALDISQENSQETSQGTKKSS